MLSDLLVIKITLKNSTFLKCRVLAELFIVMSKKGVLESWGICNTCGLFLKVLLTPDSFFSYVCDIQFVTTVVFTLNVCVVIPL